MFNLLEMQSMSSVMETVKVGFMSWGLLALGLGTIFVLLIVLSKLTGNKKDK